VAVVSRLWGLRYGPQETKEVERRAILAKLAAD